MKTRSQIFFENLPVLFTFLMPFGLNLSILIILWFITSWFVAKKDDMLSGLKNPWFLVMLGYFTLHVISAALSDNKHESFRAIEVKMGFLAFPYFFFLFKINTTTIRRIVIAFVSGCFFALIACLMRALWIYIVDGENHFYYNKFSYFMHAGYFSMYMLFASVVLFLVYPVWFEKEKWLTIMRVFLMLSFVTGIFLCASKIGIIALLAVGILLPIIKYKEVITPGRFVVFLLALCALVGILYVALPTPFERLSNAFKTASSASVDKTSVESTAVRMLIWGESMEIIKNNFWWGVGVGDANDVLQSAYKEHGLTGALEHNLNTHNQYFQTFIGLGVVGTLLLVIGTFGGMIYGFAKRNTVLVLFSVIIMLNFLVESMLQTQAGNLFYGFFVCLLLRYDLMNIQKEEHQHS